MIEAQDVVEQESVDSVVDLLGVVESAISEGRRVPFTNNVVVNEEAIGELIDRVRLQLPEEIVHARHTIQDSEKIIEAAEEEAARIIAQAEANAQEIRDEAVKHAELLVSESEIVRAAEVRAREVIAAAEQRAAETALEADGYAREVMTSLEAQLSKVSATVQHGLEALPRRTP